MPAVWRGLSRFSVVPLMSLFSPPAAPTPPPPPPAAPQLGANSIAQQGAQQRQALSNADGGGFDGTDVTGGKVATPNTTAPQKTLLGS